MLDYHLQKFTMAKAFGKNFTLEEAAKYTDMEKNLLLKQMRKLNVFLKETQQKEIKVDGTSLEIPEGFSLKWAEMRFLTTRQAQIYSERERQLLIFLYCFIETDCLSVYHFQDFLQVSKNTILSDLKRLREELKYTRCFVKYERKRGFYLYGEERVLRVYAKNAVAELFANTTGHFGLILLLELIPHIEFLTVRKIVLDCLKEQNFVIVPSRVEEVSIYFLLLLVRIPHHKVSIAPSMKNYLKDLRILKVVQQVTQSFFIEENFNEQMYCASVLMTVVEGCIDDPALFFLMTTTKRIIQRIQLITGNEFRENTQYFGHVFSHLVPAFYRIYFGYHVPNAWVQVVKLQHRELFDLTTIALEPLREITGGAIPENEIAYFTILFGGLMEEKKDRTIPRIRALILCPNGISSSLIMQAELGRLFPWIDFNLANSVKELESISENDYDVIFTNVPLITRKPFFLVQPIMSVEEKQQLIMQVQRNWHVSSIALLSPEDILKTIEPHIQLKKGVTREKILQVLTKKITRTTMMNGEDRPMLTDLLNLETIQVTKEHLNWQTAIEKAANPLLVQGKIERRYIQAMIDKVEKYGAFIHIGKQTALPHARPEDGVHELGMSLLKTSEPVLLLDDQKHAVKLFICLAAIDNEAHLRALASLTKILSQGNLIDQLLATETTEEIYNLLKKEEAS